MFEIQTDKGYIRRHANQLKTCWSTYTPNDDNYSVPFIPNHSVPEKYQESQDQSAPESQQATIRPDHFQNLPPTTEQNLPPTPEQNLPSIAVEPPVTHVRRPSFHKTSQAS